MAFPIFDIKKAMAEYNHKTNGNKKINTDDNLFRFESLIESSFQILKNANKQFLHAPRLFSGLSGKDHTGFKQDFVDAVQQLDVKRFREQISLYRQDIQKQNHQKWYEVQQKNLSSQNFWSDLIGNITSGLRSRVLTLQKKWQTQKDYAHYSSLALKHVVENILPVFDQYCDLACLELKHKGNKLPKNIAKALSQYIVQLKNELETEKQKLCWAMLGRLEVASKRGDLNAEDITIELTDALKELGVIKADTKFPEARRNLSSECFEMFHQFIEVNGRKLIKNRLQRLSWFREDNDFIARRFSNQTLLVPRPLMLFISEKTSSFSSWLNGAHFRHQFLKSHLAFMSRIRLIDKHSLSLNVLKEFPNHPTLKALNEVQKELINEYHQSSRFKPTLLQRLFHRKTIAFMKGWQDFNHQQLNKILHKKIEFLSKVSEQLRTRLDFSLDLDQLNSPEFKHSLQLLIDNIESLANQLSLNASDFNDYQESKKIIDRVLDHDIAHEADAVNELSDQEAQQDHSVMVPNLESARDKSASFVNECTMAKRFLKEFKVDRLFLENDGTLVSQLEDCSTLLKQRHDKELSLLFNKVMDHCFIEFLSQGIQCKEAECAQNLDQYKDIEKLLLTHASPSVQSRMATLEDLASKELWFLWQVKAQSYLHGLSADLSDSQSPSVASNQTQNNVKEKSPSDFRSVQFFNQRSSRDEEKPKSISDSYSAVNFSLRS